MGFWWLVVAGLAAAGGVALGAAPSAERVWAGGCLCGAVRFEVHGEPLRQTVCDCVGCRRASGAIEVPWITVAAGDYRLVRGEPREVRAAGCPADSCDGRGGTREFCPRCGSPFSFIGDDRRGREIDLAAGMLDHVEWFKPEREADPGVP